MWQKSKKMDFQKSRNNTEKVSHCIEDLQNYAVHAIDHLKFPSHTYRQPYFPLRLIAICTLARVCDTTTYSPHHTSHHITHHITSHHITSHTHNTTQHNTTQHNTTQRNATTQRNTTQHNTTRHNVAQHTRTHTAPDEVSALRAWLYFPCFCFC